MIGIFFKKRKKQPKFDKKQLKIGRMQPVETIYFLKRKGEFI